METYIPRELEPKYNRAEEYATQTNEHESSETKKW